MLCLICLAIAIFLIWGFIEGSLAEFAYAKNPEVNPFAAIGMEQYRYFVTFWFIFIPLILFGFVFVYWIITKDDETTERLIMIVVGLMFLAVIQDIAVFAFSGVGMEYSIFTTKWGLPTINFRNWQIPLLWPILLVIGVTIIYYALRECF